MMKQISILLCALCAYYVQAQQLIVNEVSQGTGGSREYVELVVVGTPSCGDEYADISEWIVDDNNSWHSSGTTGSGIAGGHVRFPDISPWNHIKYGSIILIYNPSDFDNTIVPPADPTDANNDCVYVLPITSNLLERNIDLPGNGSSMTSYAGASYSSSMYTWNIISLNNSHDAMHTVSPTDLTTSYHAVGWGNNTIDVVRNFSSGGSNKVYYMNNSVDDDPFNSNNFTQQSASTDQTPGAPNNTANANWLTSMSLGCTDFVYQSTKDTSICTGDSIFLEGEYQFVSGNYTDTLSAVGGCDSIVETQLTVLTVAQDSSQTTICTGDSALIFGNYESAPGFYSDRLPYSLGCDSLIQVVELIVSTSTTVMEQTSICAGDSIFLEGEYQFVSGNYTDTLSSVGGCDSIIETELTVLAATSTNAQVFICEGDSVLVFGEYESVQGLYVDTLLYSSGCDSLIQEVELIVNQYASEIRDTTICGGDSLFVSGAYQMQSGTYVDTIPNGGCGLIHTTNLTVAASQTLSSSLTICEGDSALVFGVYQNQGGLYSDTLFNALGCDSIIEQVNLVVNEHVEDTMVQYVCEGDSIFIGGEWISQDTSWSDTLTASNGCLLFQTYDIQTASYPTAYAGEDQQIVAGAEVVLVATGGSSYVWSTGDSLATISVFPNISTTYGVAVANEFGCTATDSVYIDVFNENLTVLLPSAFSPNGDGLNDLFYVLNQEDFLQIEMNIYNRWGEQIFSGFEHNHPWDGIYKGEQQPEEIYTYSITMLSLHTSTPIQVVGTITLFR